MKITHEKTVIHLRDETGTPWQVWFTGSWGKLSSSVFRGAEKMGAWTHRGGHANKTKAIQLVREIREAKG